MLAGSGVIRLCRHGIYKLTALVRQGGSVHAQVQAHSADNVLARLVESCIDELDQLICGGPESFILASRPPSSPVQPSVTHPLKRWLSSPLVKLIELGSQRRWTTLAGSSVRLLNRSHRSTMKLAMSAALM